MAVANCGAGREEWSAAVGPTGTQDQRNAAADLSPVAGAAAGAAAQSRRWLLAVCTVAAHRETRKQLTLERLAHGVRALQLVRAQPQQRQAHSARQQQVLRLVEGLGRCCPRLVLCLQSAWKAGSSQVKVRDMCGSSLRGLAGAAHDLFCACNQQQ